MTVEYHPIVEPGDASGENLLYQRSVTDALHPPFSYPYPYSCGEFSRRVEYYTPNSVGDRHSWKSFQHYKRVVGSETSGRHRVYTDAGGNYPGFFVATPTVSRFGYDGIYGEAGALNRDLPNFFLVAADGFVPKASVEDQVRQRALNAMLPGIRPDLSLINSLIELKDFKTLPKTIRLIANLPRKLFRSGQTLRRFFHAGADGYLQLKFNLFTVLADISGVYSALNKLERRVNGLLTREGRSQTRHFTLSAQEFTDVDESSGMQSLARFVKPNPQTGIILTRRVTHAPTVFHAEIEYNYNYTQYQRQHAALLGLLDSFGVNLNPSIIWNAIPWSFVVDWVFGVSRYLDQFKLSNMEPQLNIRRFLFSTKRQRSITVTQQCVSNSVVYPLLLNGDRYPLPTVYESSYRRDVGMPTISSIQLSGLTLSEVSLGAALVLTRRRHTRRN
jgi:hypothetical protein